MLVRMDIPGAAATGTTAVPWLLVGVLLGVGLVFLVGGTAALARPRRRPDAAPADPGGDDLPGFLESPPGSGGAVVTAGWSSLSPGPAAVPAPPTRRRGTLVPFLAVAVAGVLLGGAAVVVVAAPRTGDRPAPGRPSPATPRAAAPAARLTFGGVVLEPRSVGVTATYPVVEVSSEGGRTRARIELPTFNCLTGEAPADPVAAGCARAATEYAELAAPDLGVRTDGDRLEITGRFPTELRPNGSPPAATGRVYELRISATPTRGESRNGWRPARGVLQLGPGRAATVGTEGLNVLRAGS